MRAIGTVIASIADTDTTVLIRGESGVGKDLVARAIHAVSSRRRGPFVKVNCAAMPRTLKTLPDVDAPTHACYTAP
jgi:transcriptional regulator with PAS, ATPase and Fis domain